jgi:hypothetical protein
VIATPNLCRLASLGAALLTLTAFGLLLDVPATAGEVRFARMAVLVGLLVLSAALYFAAVRLRFPRRPRRSTPPVLL